MLHLTKTKIITVAVITTLSMLTPMAAYPLGIGNIKLQSRLNETLKAEIELQDSAHENISAIRVNIAPIGKFVEANIPWNYFLRNIKLKPVKRANGSIVIQLSSSTVLKEVFLNFIVEVSWAKGVLYRDFTVLVDPPIDYNPSFRSAIPSTKPFENNDFQLFNTGDNKKDRTQYGPTKRSDYIRGVAKKTRYDDVSIEQMIMALFNANPEAFSAENINALAEKKILIIPDREKVLEISQNEALDLVNIQNNIWKERKTRVSKTTTDIAQDNAKIPLDSSEKKYPTPNNDSTVHNNEKQLIGPSRNEVLAILAKLDRLEHKMVLMQNILVSKNKLTILPVPANEPVNTDEAVNPLASSTEGLASLTKQHELEQKIETMQKMLTLKDQLISTLQAQNKATRALIPQSVAATKEVKKEENRVATETVAKAKPGSIMRNFIQKLEANLMLLLQIGAATGLSLVGLGGYFFWLNKKKKEQAEIDALNDYLKPLNLASSSFKNLDVSRNDFLNDEHLYNADTENEIDICTEVDVYLSFFDYKHAEYLIRQAIEHYPEHNEYKLKLLEVFLASNNKTAFDSFKVQLESIVEHNNQEFWHNVAKIEGALTSGTPLYANNESEQTMPESGDSSVENMGINKTTNEPPLADDIQTMVGNEISFDGYAFNNTDVKPIAEKNIKSIDNMKTTVDDDDDEIDYGGYSFFYIEENPIIEEIFEPVNNIQTTIDDEISFDIYSFDDIEENPITEARFESNDNVQIIVDGEIDFDGYNFDFIEESPILEASFESSDNMKKTDDEISFDIYSFDDIEEKPTVDTSIKSIDNKGKKSNLTPEQLLQFKSEFENPPKGITKAEIAKKYGLSKASGYKLLKDLKYWAAREAAYKSR